MSSHNDSDSGAIEYTPRSIPASPLPPSRGSRSAHLQGGTRGSNGSSRHNVITYVNRDPENLHPHEIWWRDHQEELESRGYRLRARYQRGWTPSWKDRLKGKYSWECEDGYPTVWENLMDAVRISDGKMVMLKKAARARRESVHSLSDEVRIMKMFSSEPLASHPRNHCVPLYEVVRIASQPGWEVMVMPLLRPFYTPEFRTIGEVVDCLGQLFEGLQFMHQAHVAHRDCMLLHVMLDPTPLYPFMYHPRQQNLSQDLQRPAKYRSRTRKSTRYYFVDFSVARIYHHDDFGEVSTFDTPRATPTLGGDVTLPEARSGAGPSNPFAADIYGLGNMLREVFLENYRGLGFLEPLINLMIVMDPDKRPVIEEVVSQFDSVKLTLSSWNLRRRLVRKTETLSTGSSRTFVHCYCTIAWLLAKRPAVPPPVGRESLVNIKRHENSTEEQQT